MEEIDVNTKEPEVMIIPQKRRYVRKDMPVETENNEAVKSTGSIDYATEIKKLQAELNLANNKVAELTKIVEGMKGQYGQLEQVLNNERIKNQATKEFMLDAAKHLYISMTMAAKSGV